MSLPRVPRHRPRPKLRAIPRQKTAASAYAEMQQLAVEKQRLQQELDYLQERSQQIQERMGEINQAIEGLSADAASFQQELGQRAQASPTARPPLFAAIPRRPAPQGTFSPMIIEY